MANLNRIKRPTAEFSGAGMHHQAIYSAPEDFTPALGPDTFFSVAPSTHGSRPFYFDAPEFGFIDQLLDIGGGAGQVASLLKHRQTRMKITVFDLPPVCQQALEWFRQQGQADDLGAHAGNFFHDPLPSGFRAAQFAHVLELFSPETIIGLLKKTFDALPRDGKLILYGHACDEEKAPAKETPWSLPAMTLFVTGAGRPHAVSQYLRWLRVVGFSRISYRHDGIRTLFLMAIK